MTFLTKFLPSTRPVFSAITAIIFSVFITLPMFAESNWVPATFIKISY